MNVSYKPKGEKHYGTGIVIVMDLQCFKKNPKFMGSDGKKM